MPMQKQKKKKKKINEKEDNQDFFYLNCTFLALLYSMQSKIEIFIFYFFKVNKIFFELDIITIVAMTLAALLALLYSCKGKGF